MKLFKIIDDYIIKQELNHKLQRVSDRLRVWHEQFFEDKGKERRSHNEFADNPPPIKEEVLSPRKDPISAKLESPIDVSPPRSSLKREDLKGNSCK